MGRPKRDLVRITVNLPAHAVDRLDLHASKLGVTRTTALTLILADSLGSQTDKEKKS